MHWLGLCGKELWERHFKLLLSCCKLFQITCMFMTGLRGDSEGPLDMAGVKLHGEDIVRLSSLCVCLMGSCAEL